MVFLNIILNIDLRLDEFRHLFEIFPRLENRSTYYFRARGVKVFSDDPCPSLPGWDTEPLFIEGAIEGEELIDRVPRTSTGRQDMIIKSLAPPSGLVNKCLIERVLEYKDRRFQHLMEEAARVSSSFVSRQFTVPDVPTMKSPSPTQAGLKREASGITEMEQKRLAETKKLRQANDTSPTSGDAPNVPSLLSSTDHAPIFYPTLNLEGRMANPNECPPRAIVVKTMVEFSFFPKRQTDSGGVPSPKAHEWGLLYFVSICPCGC